MTSTAHHTSSTARTPLEPRREVRTTTRHPTPQRSVRDDVPVDDDLPAAGGRELHGPGPGPGLQGQPEDLTGPCGRRGQVHPAERGAGAGDRERAAGAAG